MQSFTTPTTTWKIQWNMQINCNRRFCFHVRERFFLPAIFFSPALISLRPFSCILFVALLFVSNFFPLIFVLFQQSQLCYVCCFAQIIYTFLPSHWCKSSTKTNINCALLLVFFVLCVWYRKWKLPHRLDRVDCKTILEQESCVIGHLVTVCCAITDLIQIINNWNDSISSIFFYLIILNF